MSIAVNGQSQVPPGFRFHPTEEELLGYYLRKKVANEPIELDVIREIDLNRKEPWDIQEECRIGSGPQNDWYLFSHKDRKYPTGTRTNRATTAGFWKATGRDKAIRGPGGRDGSGRRIGMRKTLVFYTGRAPHGCKSDWIMHEYRLEDEDEDKEGEDSADRGAKGQKFERPDDCGCGAGEDSAGQESDGWVICRVFKKKNFFQQASSKVATTARSGRSHEEEITKPLPPRYHTMDIDVIQEPRRPSKIEASARSKTPVAALFDNGFGAIMDIPALESPVSEESPELVTPPTTSDKNAGSTGQGWAVVDRLIASHLDGAHPEIPTYLDGDRCPEQGYGTYKADGAGLGYPDVCSSHGGPDPDLWLLLQSSTWSLT